MRAHTCSVMVSGRGTGQGGPSGRYRCQGGIESHKQQSRRSRIVVDPIHPEQPPSRKSCLHSWEDPELVNLPEGINMVIRLFRRKNVLEGRCKHCAAALVEMFLVGKMVSGVRIIRVKSSCSSWKLISSQNIRESKNKQTKNPEKLRQYYYVMIYKTR